jgi:hypothetical protein
MSNDKMREEFEAWIKSRWPDTWIDRVPVGAGHLNEGAYWGELPRLSWDAWQASRESLVIELPTIKNADWACDSGECEAMRSGIRMSRSAINAAGIKVKPEPVHVDPHTCSACGAKGWSANCDQCIPF